MNRYSVLVDVLVSGVSELRILEVLAASAEEAKSEAVEVFLGIPNHIPYTVYPPVEIEQDNDTPRGALYMALRDAA